MRYLSFILLIYCTNVIFSVPVILSDVILAEVVTLDSDSPDGLAITPEEDGPSP